MKIAHIISSLGILVIAAIAITSCGPKPTYTPTSQYQVSVDDAANAIGSAIASSSNGIAAEITAMSTFNAAKGAYTTSSKLPCGLQFDTAYTRTGNTNGNYSYSVDWDYLLACVNGMPDSITVNQNMQGSYSTSLISGVDTSSATLTITGIQPSSSAITVNGTYTRNGQESSKVRTLLSYYAVMTFNIIGLTMNKSTQQITGGTATVGFIGVGTAPNYKTYSSYYTGYVQFNGDNTASITINGNAYNISL